MRTFPTQESEILKLLEQIEPLEYAQTRNYLNGAVTHLSPYISRGVLTTKAVFEHLKNQNYSWQEVEKLVQELAWRDYFQLVWMRLGEKINHDIRQPQERVVCHSLPKALLLAETGILAVDRGISTLLETGYMHNHVRMYTAALACNIGRYHWREPARWMYYHLLDADWASNACSWQWVAGAFSNKKYYANQENINRYCNSNQINTYLDISYEELAELKIPDQWRDSVEQRLKTQLPETSSNLSIDSSRPTLIYNWYNLDFNWHANSTVNRVLLIEPGVFGRYPISEKSIQFMLSLAGNIPGIQVFVGEFHELQVVLGSSQVIFKEHPLNHYSGEKESREFLTAIPDKNFNSFFSFWKSIEKQLHTDFESR